MIRGSDRLPKIPRKWNSVCKTAPCVIILKTHSSIVTEITINRPSGGVCPHHGGYYVALKRQEEARGPSEVFDPSHKTFCVVTSMTRKCITKN